MDEPTDTAEAVTHGNGHDGAAQPREEGAVQLPDGRLCIGRVGAPVPQEATSNRFYFWAPSGVLIEDTQLVVCDTEIGGRNYRFYGIIDQVRRRSRHRDMAAEFDEADGDLTYLPHFVSNGYTYAQASILRTEPPVLTSPRERSPVTLAGAGDAQIAYSADLIRRELPVGIIKNGGNQTAGPGLIDLDYLLGIYGGHMNVNGSAGRGTKSSYLLWVIWMLLQKARQQALERPSDVSRLRIVPIIFNVKNFDLFYIDRRNREFDRGRHLAAWQELGIADPQPFNNVRFLAAQQQANNLPVPTGRSGGVEPYSWSLRDIIENELFLYLFAETDVQDVNFSALVLDIQNFLTDDRIANDGTVTYQLNATGLNAATFQGLLDWIDAQIQAGGGALRNHHTGTWRKLYRRLFKMVYESGGVLRRNDEHGHPLDLARGDTTDPVVVDLAALARQPELQRFVVATIFRQLVQARTGANALQGLVYLVMLDELNRFAPRGARDPITELIETVAAEMRSQGIILLGAQQQASKVSEKVIENAAIRVLGMSGSLELSQPVWRFLSESARRKASSLPLDEKLVIQDNFREPMQVRVPFPVWAMNRQEAAEDVGNAGDGVDDFIDE